MSSLDSTTANGFANLHTFTYYNMQYLGTKMFIRSTVVLVVSALSTLAVAEELVPKPGAQVATTATIQTTDKESLELQIPLLLYAPDNYDANGQAWPLVLFLHGLGESGLGGAELNRVAKHGPPRHAADGKALPFILVSPQCPRPAHLEEAKTAWRSEQLLPLLDRLKQQLNVDAERVYVTGLSMGGYGSWRLATVAPERFAAAAPICGGGDPEAVDEAIGQTTIWAFHGQQDKVVPVTDSHTMVDAVNLAGGAARLTIYPKAGHDSWTKTYDNPMFYDWLLGERRQ